MEPERRIEKWLRAFAKKRREQAGEPMTLRPAMRQRLQREIARQAEEKSRGGFFYNFFFGPRLKLTFAACFAALVMGGWFLLHESAEPKPATLSMNKTSYPEMLPNTAASEMPPVTSPAIARTDKKVLAEKTKDVPVTPQPTPPIVASANRSLAAPPDETVQQRDRAESASGQKQLAVTTIAAAAPASNTTLAFKNEAAVDSIGAAGAITTDAEGALPTVAVPQSSNFIARAGTPAANPQTFNTAIALQGASATPGSSAASFDLSKDAGAVTVSQLFNRLDAPATRRSVANALITAPKLLTSFRVEQAGNNLKIVDADGSVYTGSVQIAQQEPAADYAVAAARNSPRGKSQLAKAPAQVPQSYFFRVAGTNRNLNENVIFSGNFVPFTNNQPAVGNRSIGGFGGGNFAGGAGAPRDQSAAQPVQAVLSNSEINGNVVIGNQKAINVIATPAH